MLRRVFAASALFLLAGAMSAQNVGSYLADVELEDFAQTKAKSLDDYLGRTVLIEFFAYW